MSGILDVSRGLLRPSLARTAGFLAFWLILSGLNLGDLPVGVLAAVIATWTSLRLLPAWQRSFRPIASTRLAFRFLSQSIVAGTDVARRALDPRLPLHPGFVTYPVRFPPGATRNAFTALTSLLPGTVPAGNDGENLVYHCLDIDQPVAAQLAAEEIALSRAVGDD